MPPEENNDDILNSIEDKEVAPETVKVADSTVKEEGKKEEEIQAIIRARLKQKQKEWDQKEAEFQAKEADYQTKIRNYENGNASGAQMGGTPANAQGMQQPNVQAQAAPVQQQEAPPKQDNGIPAELLPYVLAEQEKQLKKQFEFTKKIDDAADKDDEFKKLLENAPFPIPKEIVPSMQHLDNAAAVAKHLLKDGKDNAAMMAAANESGYTLIRFLNELSNKLDAKASKPEVSKFKPAVNLADVGDADQDWDMAEYVKGVR